MSIATIFLKQCTINFAIGSMIQACARSRSYLDWEITDIERLFVPPATLNQYQLIMNDSDKCIGFVTWAEVTSEMLGAIKSDQEVMNLEDWNAGTEIVLMDFVCEKTYLASAIRLIKSQVFTYDFFSKRNLQSCVAHLVRRDQQTGIIKRCGFMSREG